MESKKEKKIDTIKNWIIILLIFIIIVLCDTTMKMNENNKKLTEQVESLVEIDKEQTKQIKELWVSCKRTNKGIVYYNIDVEFIPGLNNNVLTPQNNKRNNNNVF